MLYRVSGYHVDECNECHYNRPGYWYEDEETGVEWFICDSCREESEEETS